MVALVDDTLPATELPCPDLSAADAPEDPAAPEAEPGDAPLPGQPTVLDATPALPIDNREIVLSAVLLLAWIAFLTAGITVGTHPYIELIGNGGPLDAWAFLGCAITILICNTIPNLAFLCCFSTFMGVIGSRTIDGGESPDGAPPERRTAYASAITRGFFIYIIILSGTIMVSDEALTHISQEKYVRLAGLASLISFATGYNPAFFRRLLSRIDSVTGASSGENALKGVR